MTMRTDIKRRWINALRSGIFAKGTGQLKTMDYGGQTRYCCLGVLQELAVIDGVISPSERESMFGYGFSFGKKDEDGHYTRDTYAQYVLSEVVRQWAGLAELNPRVAWDEGIQAKYPRHEDDPDVEDIAISGVNDCGHFTFDEIADILERNTSL